MSNRVRGVYAIRNMQTGQVYIGSSENIHVRLLSHRSELNRGGHPNSRLQADWKSHGESAFTFDVVEEMVADGDLESCECAYLALYEASQIYNRAQTAKRRGVSAAGRKSADEPVLYIRNLDPETARRMKVFAAMRGETLPAFLKAIVDHWVSCECLTPETKGTI